ncbi:MAG: MaoC family dehydratase N-terminal domain-containing protein [Chloroflexi bacterium]|nr:MaoC family dehydratase N-terminal domain-containing protein [Chloroflexota bacterium]
MTQAIDVFSDENLSIIRSRIGSPVPRGQQFNEVATRDAIRHFAQGYGDVNPLWCDDSYAGRTRYGCIVAPPLFLYSCEWSGQGAAAMGLRGAHSLWTGDEWEWFHPVRVNDRITFEEKLLDLREVQGKFAARLFEQIAEKTFKNQSGQLVARCLMTCRRFTRYPESEKGEKRDKYQDARKKYDREELQAIFADYDKEEIRGGSPRYWEDVREGDALAHVVKGPLTVTDVIAWYIGMGPQPFIRAHGIRLAYDRRHPAAAIPNALGIPDVPMRVHWEDDLARTIGFPAAYDMGNQRITWVSQVMTNWTGDDGFLKKFKIQLRRPNLIGDTCWCRGKVIRKYVANGEHLVDCELWADNQRGERSAIATATASLPSRQADDPQYHRRPRL